MRDETLRRLISQLNKVHSKSAW